MTKPSKVKKLLAELPAFRSLALLFDAGAETLGDVADRLGKVAAVRAELEEYEKALKNVIIENREDAVEGRLFRAVLIKGSRESLDTGAIRDAMTEKWLAKYTRTKRFTTVKIHARQGVDQAA